MAERRNGAANCRRRHESRKLSAPPGSAPVLARPTPHGLRTLLKPLCRHHAWLVLRLVLPEMCDVAKVFLDPLVGIDGIKVTFSAVVKNDYARRALGYPLLHLFDCHEHSSRRGTSENGLAVRQAPTAHDTVQVRHPHTLVGQ